LWQRHGARTLLLTVGSSMPSAAYMSATLSGSLVCREAFHAGNSARTCSAVAACSWRECAAWAPAGGEAGVRGRAGARAGGRALDERGRM
jgi:hypothetical protein